MKLIDKIFKLNKNGYSINFACYTKNTTRLRIIRYSDSVFRDYLFDRELINQYVIDNEKVIVETINSLISTFK